MNISIKRVENDNDLNICANLRKQVFGDEENAPDNLYIIDEYDKNADTKNYLLNIDNKPVATVRLNYRD